MRHLKWLHWDYQKILPEISKQFYKNNKIVDIEYRPEEGISFVLGWKVSGRIPGLGKGHKLFHITKNKALRRSKWESQLCKVHDLTENVLHKEEDAIYFTYIQENDIALAPIRSFSRGVVNISHDLENNVLVKDLNRSFTEWSVYWQLLIFVYNENGRNMLKKIEVNLGSRKEVEKQRIWVPKWKISISIILSNSCEAPAIYTGRSSLVVNKADKALAPMGTFSSVKIRNKHINE